jgi:hypothetical protein
MCWATFRGILFTLSLGHPDASTVGGLLGMPLHMYLNARYNSVQFTPTGFALVLGSAKK